MKKNAWTLLELTVIMIVILVLTAASMSVMKTINVNKMRIYTYSAIRNLTMGSIAIKDKYGEMYPDEAKTSDNNAAVANDWYCMNLVDSLMTDGAINCIKNIIDGTPISSPTPNFKLANGIYVYGASNSWRTAYGDLHYKDMMFDINGNGGADKIGVDRFPLRVFRGATAQGYNADALVQPVDCTSGQDYLTDTAGNKITLSSTYCTGGSVALASDSEFLTYAVYKVVDTNKPNSAVPILAGRSAVEADCLAHGAKGLYGKQLCSANAYKLYPECAHEETCAGCEADGTCPNSGTEANCNALAQNNKFRCFALMSKPTAGLGLMGIAVMNEVGL